MALISALRNAAVYFRPFGLSGSESLMNLSHLGALSCQCEPTDAAAPRNDRRRSCRACGNAILATEPTRLYERLSRSDIRRLTRSLRRAGMDAGRVGFATKLTNLSGLEDAGSLAELASRMM